MTKQDAINYCLSRNMTPITEGCDWQYQKQILRFGGTLLATIVQQFRDDYYVQLSWTSEHRSVKSLSLAITVLDVKYSSKVQPTEELKEETL